MSGPDAELPLSSPQHQAQALLDRSVHQFLPSHCKMRFLALDLWSWQAWCQVDRDTPTTKTTPLVVCFWPLHVHWDIMLKVYWWLLSNLFVTIRFLGFNFEDSSYVTLVHIMIAVSMYVNAKSSLRCFHAWQIIPQRCVCAEFQMQISWAIFRGFQFCIMMSISLIVFSGMLDVQ